MMDEINLPTLPAEMVEEILFRLDPKPLSRLKSVCKGFNKLISSKEFMKTNLDRMKHMNRKVFILHSEFCFTPLFYDVAFINDDTNGRLTTADDKNGEILAASNGLVLYCNLSDEFFLLNPITSAKATIPTCKISFPDGCTWAQVFFGMGFLPEKDDYVVVRIAVFNSFDFNSEVMMFSRNNGLWTTVSKFPDDFPVAQAGVCVKGRLHWRSSLFLNKYTITSFNLHDGTYSSMSVPDVPLFFGVQQLVCLDEDTLALTCSVLYHGSPFSIWILKNYFDPSSWVKINIDTSTAFQTERIVQLQPLCMLNPGGAKLLFRLDPAGHFGVYDIKKSEFCMIEADDMQEGYATIYTFVPCLHTPGPMV